MLCGRFVVPVVFVALLASLAGCGGPPQGTDSDLVDDWVMLPAAKVAVPLTGVCYRSFSARSSDMHTVVAFSSEALECTAPHESETFYVGTVAEAADPPRGAALATAYGTCSTKAKDFLGEDWHNGLVDLLTLVPSSTQWRGGARYLRCDLVEIKSNVGYVVQRNTSLKDGLRGTRPAARTCAKSVLSGEDLQDMTAVPCTAPHDAEYAGTYMSNAPTYPSTFDKRRDVVGDGCFAIVAQYVGLTEAKLDGVKDFNMGWWMTDEEPWAYGDRSTTCLIFLSTPGKTISKSLKGNGTAKI